LNLGNLYFDIVSNFVLRISYVAILGISTLVESALQIRLFMQNKANFRKSQMNVNKVLTRDYKKRTLGGVGKTNPKQTQFKAIQSQFLRDGIHIFDKHITSSLHKPTEVFMVEPLKYCIERT
jgi:hypothetical protein